MALKECAVAVVGAGFAGLAAAQTLRQRGVVDVIVLEASRRVGGRAHTIQLPRYKHDNAPGCPTAESGFSVELGATWIHGTGSMDTSTASSGRPVPVDVNPILSLAATAGLMPLRPKVQQWWDSKYIWLPNQGDARVCNDKSELVTIHKAVQAYAEAMESIEEQGGDIEYRSVGDVLSSAWTRLASTLSSDEDLKLAKAAWHWREGLQRAMDGCETTGDMSAEARGMYSEYGGSEEHASVTCGYQTLAETLAGQGHRVEDRIPILLGHEVERIDYDNGAGNDDIILHCSNGQTIKALSVIVTFSLGVLKARHATMFSPPLPNGLVNAMERLRIGTVDKLIIDFSASLNSDSHTPSTRNDDTESEVVSFSFLQEEVLSESGASGSDWTRGIFSFRLGGPEFHDEGTSAESQEAEDRNCLAPPYAVVWLTGEAAREMEMETEDSLLNALQSWYARTQPAVKLPRGLDWTTARVVRSRWGDDPLFRGSYSYVGADGSVEDVVQLSRGIVKQSAHGVAPWPAVLFAGEACHPQYIVSVL